MSTRLINEEHILKEAPRLGPEDRLQFRCDAGLDCFTHCCRDVSIVLTPYDIIRLKRALGVDSSGFLEKYTISPFTAEQKFPIVLLRMQGEERRCPFVSEKGCGVYAGRPWACRMYPLGVAAPRNPNPDEHAFHFLVREELCHGHQQGASCSVSEWLAGQGIEEYEMMGVPFRDLTLHPFWDGDQTLTPQQVEMFHMVCYDLDRFRRFVFETRFLSLFEVDEARVEALRRDDLELFEFGVQWLRFSLFRERSMKLRRAVMEGSRT